MITKDKKLNRYYGTLIGLAVGDALGTTLEFERPGTFTPISDMVGGGPFKLNSGEWTDDTSMALCLAKSLIENKGFDPYDQMDKYFQWYTNGYMSSKPGRCVDIGMATQQALIRYYNDYQPFCGDESRNKAGNGSIMRLCPIPMFFMNHEAENIRRSGISSMTTHKAPQSVSACRYFGHLIALALKGTDKENILRDHSTSKIWDDEPLDSTIKEIAHGSFKKKSPPDIVGSGYVVKSLEAALWAFYTTNNFEDGALKAVNLGNDADTTGAVYGQIAGAYYGLDDIPINWRAKLFMLNEMLEMAEELYKLSQLNENEND